MKILESNVENTLNMGGWLKGKLPTYIVYERVVSLHSKIFSALEITY